MVVVAPYYHYYAMQYKKVQKSSRNEPYSSSFTKQSCSKMKMALYRWIRTESRWNKKLISLSSPDWSASKLATEFRKENATRRIDWTQWLNGNWLKNVMSLDVWIVRSLIFIFFSAHQHKACRQLKIKQEMTYYYYAAFNAPCVGHEDEELQCFKALKA